MNRGSRAGRRPAAGISGFNEAPIHESGKIFTWAGRSFEYLLQ